MAEPPTMKINTHLDVEVYDRRVDQIVSRTDELEKRVQRLVQSYGNNAAGGSGDESVQSKRMQYLMQQFHNILCRIMNHKWAFPFRKPVDAVGLGLYDYHEVIRKPMDLGTILNRMKAKEESRRYKNITDVCADVRLVFTNAMKYNDPGTDVHTMAQELSSEFEKMWYPLSLKVAEEERRQHEHEVQEAEIMKLTRYTEEELMGLSMQLEELRKQVTKNCRKLSIDERRMLLDNVPKLSQEDINKALEIAAKYDPDLDVSSFIVDFDLGSMNLIAQWMVYNFVEKCIKSNREGIGR